MNTDERRAREALLRVYDFPDNFEELYRGFLNRERHISQTPSGIVEEFLKYLTKQKIAFRKKEA